MNLNQLDSLTNEFTNENHAMSEIKYEALNWASKNVVPYPNMM